MPDEDKRGETVASISDSPALTPTLPAPGLGSVESPLPAVAADRYQLADEIGRGGIGRVLRARDTVLDREIAIKELRDDEDDGARRRFVREAMITARLQHPAIVPIYEAGRRGDAPFYAMKLVTGKTLADAITAAGTLAARLALLPNVLAVADAVAFAHRERIVHRDLKPGNVLLGEFGETVVIDWGLAKDLAIDDQDAADAGPYRHAEPRLDRTVAGAVLGTPAYMPPEQAEGKDVDERADVYAIGAMLYHVVSGAMPHEGDSMDAMIANIIRGEIVAVTTREPEVPSDLATVINKAMARRPDQRYPTARELADDLRRYQTGQLVASHRYTVYERLARWLRRYRSLLGVAAIAAVALLGYGVWSMREITRKKDSAVAERNAAAGNNNKVKLAHARTALERDPAEALAWLAMLDPGSDEGWAAARALAGEAWARPRPDRISATGPRDGALTTNARLIVQSSARTVHVTNVDTGDDHVYAIQTNFRQAFACDDGRHVIGFGSFAGSDSGIATIDIVTDQVTVAPGGPFDADLAIARCSQQRRFYNDGRDLRVWNPQTGNSRTLGPLGFTRHILPTLDGGHALAPRADGVLARLDRDGPPDEIKWFVPTVDKVRFSSDGKIVAFASRKGVEVANLETHQVGMFEDMPADAVAVAPDGSWIAIARADYVRLIGFDKTVRSVLPHASKLATLDVSPDGKWLLGTSDNRATLWNIASPEPRVLATRAPIKDSAFVGTAVITQDAAGELRWWALAESPPSPLQLSPTRAAMSRDGRTLAFSTSFTVERVRGDQHESVELPSASAHLAVDDDGTVAIGAIPSGAFRWRTTGELDKLDQEMLASFPDGNHVAWSRRRLVTWDNSRLALWKPEGVVRYDPVVTGPGVYMSEQVPGASGPVIRLETRKDPRWRASAFAVSPDGRWVATSTAFSSPGVGQTSAIALTDLDAGTTHQLPTARCDRPTFTADSRGLVTGSADGALILWDVADRRPQVLGRGDIDAAVTAISRDGRRMAIAGGGGVVIAEPGSGTPAVRFSIAGRVQPQHAAFTADGNTLVAADASRLYFFDLVSRESWSRELEVLALGYRDGDLVAVTTASIVVLENRLPADRVEFAHWLARLPYQLDDDQVVTR